MPPNRASSFFIFIKLFPGFSLHATKNHNHSVEIQSIILNSCNKYATAFADLLHKCCIKILYITEYLRINACFLLHGKISRRAGLSVELISIMKKVIHYFIK